MKIQQIQGKIKGIRDIKEILANKPDKVYIGQLTIKDMNKEVKKRYFEMNKVTKSTHTKFLSVYRYKTPLKDSYEFSTSMHYYKRDLSPIKEGSNFICPIHSPYEANLV